ncbi:hypothetical protein BRADI_5g06622v3 [Brachypodium distachyon]|uniref:Uncharacterized protein n=1 Tax=Brachypodium distachyon TaxID=15368 RepID=A0A2K2CFN9_BRADI|nr:hypothetical protein BRADI_5g06622v3 [Brachypodium distachyon]
MAAISPLDEVLLAAGVRPDKTRGKAPATDCFPQIDAPSAGFSVPADSTLLATGLPVLPDSPKMLFSPSCLQLGSMDDSSLWGLCSNVDANAWLSSFWSSPLEPMLFGWPITGPFPKLGSFGSPLRVFGPPPESSNVLGLSSGPAVDLVFGPGAQLVTIPEGLAPCISDFVVSEEEIRARRAPEKANLSGPGLLDAITARVASLQVDEQRRFMSKIASVLSPSLLGMPLIDHGAMPAKSPVRKRLFSSVRKAARFTKTRSYMKTRSSQAVICRRLGLIENEADFNDDTLKMYLSFFRNPLPPSQSEELADLTGVNTAAKIDLPDAELQAILDELVAMEG